MPRGFNSPHADPLDRYETFRAAVEDGDDDADEAFVRCDFCDFRRATLIAPQGWPICQDCAETPNIRDRE